MRTAGLQCFLGQNTKCLGSQGHLNPRTMVAATVTRNGLVPHQSTTPKTCAITYDATFRDESLLLAATRAVPSMFASGIETKTISCRQAEQAETTE